MKPADNKATATAISPTRAEDFPEWYQQVVRAADMADNSDVRGCMVIKPWGYGIWELMQREMDARIKATGHKNAYFPLFIPLSYMAREAKHVEGFAKECAVVTHHRLIADGKGGLIADPKAELEEPLIVRPTSETIIGASFAKWVQSYRDLPLLINQWCNVVRWEMRTRLFLRTSEFLWQEGHTAHETKEEAIAETMKMLEVYKSFAREFLAMPVFGGPKTESERFAGAVDTFGVESMSQDKKAIQFGTSHFLGQNFAKAFGIKFVSRANKEDYCWTSSWGVSTRMIGAMIMTHSDDNGLVLPPPIAPTQIAILPILKPDTREAVLKVANELKAKLEAQSAFGSPIRVEIDTRDIGGGTKNWEWIKKGVPMRVEIGPRDIEKGNLVYTPRTWEPSTKNVVSIEEFVKTAPSLLKSMRDFLYTKAEKFMNENTHEIGTPEALEKFFADAKEGQAPGFALTPWEGFSHLEGTMKEKFGVTVRCHPSDRKINGKLSAIWAQSY
jgi:prolyl-tRNA synthetase